MRVFFLDFFVYALVVGCASPSHSPKKPSPCHYLQAALSQALRG
jgi:hypothetical protein